MMVRLFKWDTHAVYKHYNLDHPSWPNLPPPPNPEGLQSFMAACVDVTLDQMRAENDPNSQKSRKTTTADEIRNLTNGSRGFVEGKPNRRRRV